MGSDWQSDANTNNNTNVTSILPPSLVPSITGKIAVVSKLTGGKNDKHSHSSINLNTPDSCIIVGGPGIGTGLELNGQLRDIIDNLTPLNFGMGREARGRSRRQPTLFNPQTCAASDWQSDANTNNNTNVTSILPPSLVPSITGKIAVVSKSTGGKNDKHSHSSTNLNTPDSCIIVGGPGIGTGLELNGQLRDIIDNLTPLNFGMGREARGRSRRQPTLFNPQTCAARDWQSDANTNNNTNVTSILPPSLAPSITGKIAVVSKLTGGKNDKHSHSSNNLNDKNMSSTSNLDSI